MIRPYRPDDLEAVLSVWEKASAVGHPFLSVEFLARGRDGVCGFIALGEALHEETGLPVVRPRLPDGDAFPD